MKHWQILKTFLFCSGSILRKTSDDFHHGFSHTPESGYCRSSRELPVLGSASLSSLSTVVQLGSRTNSPFRPESGSPYHDGTDTNSKQSTQESLGQQQQQQQLQQQPVLQPPLQPQPLPPRKKKARRPTPITPKTPRQIGRSN